MMWWHLNAYNQQRDRGLISRRIYNPLGSICLDIAYILYRYCSRHRISQITTIFESERESMLIQYCEYKVQAMWRYPPRLFYHGQVGADLKFISK